MKTKKTKSTKTRKVYKSSGVTTRTWIMFGVFLLISYFCIKMIITAQAIANSVVIPAPIAVPTVSQVHKAVKK